MMPRVQIPIDGPPLNIETVNLEDTDALDAFHDAWIAAGKAKLRDDLRRLQELGIVDEDGKQLGKPISADL